MIRRLLALMLCALLLAGALPAMAEEESGYELPVMFRLMDVDEEGNERMMGTALLFGDQQTLLTTIWAMQHTGTVKAVGPDGDYSLTNAIRPTEDSELALLTLDRACPEQPMQLISSGTEADMAFVLGCTWDGEFVVAVQDSVKPARYAGRRAGLVCSSEKLAPGACTMDAAGMLSGLVMASWGEAANRYAALTRDMLAEDFLRAGMVTEKESGWLESVALTYEEGLLRADWSSCEGLDMEKNIHVYIADESNLFYSWVSVAEGETFVDLPVVPGRSYSVWVQQTEGEERSWEGAPSAPSGRMDIPEAQMLTKNDFRSLSCLLASASAEEIVDTAASLPVMESVTADALADESVRLYLQVTDAYSVDQEMEATLTIAFFTPDGQCYPMLSGYIYMPSLSSGDTWNADVTDIVRTCVEMGEGFVPGEYTLAYYIGGEYANSVHFTLE